MKTRIILTVLLIAFLIGSWTAFILSSTKDERAYKANMKQAQEWEEEGLYQRAILKYKEAIEYNPAQENWMKMMYAYEKRKKEDFSGTIKAYISDLESAVAMYPDNFDFIWTLKDLYVEDNNPENACKTIETGIQALEKKMEDAKKSDKDDIDGQIDELKVSFRKIRYGFSPMSVIAIEKYKEDKGYHDEWEGTYALYQSVSEWTLEEETEDSEETTEKKESKQITKDAWNYWGEYSTDVNADYVSPMSPEGISIITKEYTVALDEENDKGDIKTNKELQSRLINTDNFVMGIFDKPVYKAGLYAEGRVAVGEYDEKKKEWTYQYYNEFAQVAIKEVYEEAGTFSDGKAAVKQDGKWFIIDTEGKKVDKNDYYEIVLDNHGYYLHNNMMMAAKKAGEFCLYDKKLKKLGSYYEDAGFISDDGLIAVKNEDGWGYIDTKGNEVIELSSDCEEAKSFVNGVAPVKVNDGWCFIDRDGEIVVDGLVDGLNRKKLFEDISYVDSEGRFLVLVHVDNSSEKDTEEEYMKDAVENKDEEKDKNEWVMMKFDVVY